MIRRFLLALACLPPGSASAALAPAALNEVALAPPPNAVLPLDASLRDGKGATTLGRLLAEHPASVFVFADYTCRSVCGAELSIAAASLADPHLADLNAGLVVVGLDPKDGAAEAARMQAEILGNAFPVAARFLSADRSTVDRLTRAAGYRYRYDPETDQFAHPAAVLTLTREGRVGRALAGLSLMPETLRTALVEAGQGRIGTVVERISLRCYAFDPATGLYTADVKRWLRIAAGCTILVLGLGLFALVRRSAARETA